MIHPRGASVALELGRGLRFLKYPWESEAGEGGQEPPITGQPAPAEVRRPRSAAQRRTEETVRASHEKVSALTSRNKLCRKLYGTQEGRLRPPLTLA